MNLQAEGGSTICSYLGDNSLNRVPDVDVFKFYGTKGDKISITLKAEVTEGNEKKRAGLMLKDLIRGVRVFKRKSGKLPNQINIKLPADGMYAVTVSELFYVKKKKRFEGAYCLTLESGAGAQLEATKLTE